MLAVCTAGGLLQGLWLLDRGTITIGELVAYIGLLGLLGFPAFVSIFSFSLVQDGIASANRLLKVMREETELDHNEAGRSVAMRGAIRFDDVTFSYGGRLVLQDLSVHDRTWPDRRRSSARPAPARPR